ncbi:HDOD domain-containing protein [Pseudomaricurvus alcaniphilus]|uniref:HDOD domain-containing protein n=1 Tax=Pseudomaricurvus alcaniphilus TaxID=1166482 RepID=UPI001408F1E8|nr:HDOD domain-containing protein [Pseudomaricurvus alcaniphilus]NHN37786.1 HDOD domain-containing protein [Pseudomaricurvus alcaniphilus]
MSDIHLDPERLRQFRPFAGLDAHQLLLLKSRVELLRVPKGSMLFELGDIDSNEYFLLDGEFELHSEDGKVHRVDQDHSSAKRQLGSLRPRQYTAVATRLCEVVVLDADILDELQQDSAESSSGEEGYGVSEVASMEEMESQELLSGFHSALQRNQFVLPSLPEVALKVRHLLENENSNAELIAAAVNADPSIAAKLIRAANSPIYHGTTTCDSTKNAIVRLGLDTTRQLVVSFAIKDLFSSRSPQLHKYMLKAWRHSVEVAAISFVIARMVKAKSISAEEAMLAGLVHEIGVIAILGYMDSQGDIDRTPEQLDQVIDNLRGEVGEMILRRWKFPQEIVVVARSVSEWQRKHPLKVDICDIVQIAKLHSIIRNKQPLPVHRIDQVPAFHKLPLGDLTPELTIRILDEAREQIAAIKQVLSG